MQFGETYDGSQLERDVNASLHNHDRLRNYLKLSEQAIEQHKDSLQFWENAVKDIKSKLPLSSRVDGGQ